jgi:precorrin-6B methylase 1
VAGVHEKCRKQDITSLKSKVTIIELPHSGYMPENINEQLKSQGITSRIFLLELDKQRWLSIGGMTGNITSLF